MSQRFVPFVDRALADAFGLTIEELHAPGTRVVSDAPGFRGYAGIYVLHLGESILISVPALSAPFGRVLGPSIHSYLHRDDHRGGEGGGRRIRPDDPDDVAAVAAFRVTLGAAEWYEAGFGDPLPPDTWATFDGTRIVAMGNLTEFGGHPADVGLATHPAHRGRGHGRRLAVSMLDACFQVAEVARYRALAGNAASLAVARHLGFEPYGENVAIRLRSP